MWLVRLALRRPYSVATFCITMVLLGVLSMRSMQTDVLPAIDIPVVIVVFNYPGLSAPDMQNRVLLVAQRGYSTTVDGVDHMEAEAILGVGILKVYFAQGTNVGSAIAQITAQTQQQFAPFFAALSIQRVIGASQPIYNVRAVCHSGAILTAEVAT